MYVSPLQPPYFFKMIRLISFYRCSSVSSRLNSHDMLCVDQNANFLFIQKIVRLLFSGSGLCFVWSSGLVEIGTREPKVSLSSCVLCDGD